MNTLSLLESGLQIYIYSTKSKDIVESEATYNRLIVVGSWEIDFHAAVVDYCTLQILTTLCTNLLDRNCWNGYAT